MVLCLVLPQDPRQDQEPSPYVPVHPLTAVSNLLSDSALLVADTCWSMRKSRSCSLSPVHHLRDQPLSTLPSLDLRSRSFSLAYIVKLLVLSQTFF